MAGAIVIGAGPGIGAAVVRRAAREGLPVGAVARSPATLAARNGDALAVTAITHLAPRMADLGRARPSSPAGCRRRSRAPRASP